MGLFNLWREKSHPSQEAEFDIEGMAVFSIERDNNETVIAYRREERQVLISAIAYQTGVVFPGVIETIAVEDTWNITTTDEQHLKFCERLAAKIAKREQAK